jgi:L-amino acid N-acyltransferase
MVRRPATTKGWVIRPAAARDARAIAEVYNESVLATVATFDTRPRTLAAQRRWLAGHGPRYPVRVAEANGVVIGWASLSEWSDRPAYGGTAEVSIYVRTDWRGHGVGRTLLQDLVAQGERNGFHTLLARVSDGNPASTRLHLALGFRSVGVMREVGFKFGRWIDVELFQRLLDPAPRTASRIPQGRPTAPGSTDRSVRDSRLGSNVRLEEGSTLRRSREAVGAGGPFPAPTWLASPAV